MELRFELWGVLMMTVLQALANPTPQNYERLNNSGDSQLRNDTSSHTRRIDGRANNRRTLPNQPPRKPLISFTEQSNDCGDTYCTSDPNYPSEVIASLNKELKKFEYLFGEDFVDTISVRFDADESGLCQSRRRLIYPKRGQSVQNTWLTIINDDEKYRQGVTIEECQNAHLPCEYSQSFPLGVESKCKQQYVYRNLLAINSEGKPVMEHFQFPSCCKCMVTSSSSRSYNRFGADNSDNERKDRLILA